MTTEDHGRHRPHLPAVSVLMPVRNEAAYIARSLGAVLRQDYPSDLLEVLVVDGMSTDQTREIVRKFQRDHSNVRLLDNKQRIAPSALNLATAEAKGEVLVRVDGHCEIAPDYIWNCVRHLSEDGVDGVGGSLVTIGEDDAARAIAAAMSSSYGVGGAAFRTVSDRTMLADTIPFPAYTREIVRRVGPYDERFVRNQDDEYNYRIRKLGGRLLLAADVRSRYYSRATLASLFRQYYGYGLWKGPVLVKHPRQMKARQFVPAVFVAALIIGFVFCPFSGRVRRLLAALVLAYLGMSGVAAQRVAARTEWRFLPKLPVAFAALHLSYGIGFWHGLAKMACGSMPSPSELRRSAPAHHSEG